ncbi:carboxylesterase/lipase family protein [Sandaracinobacteroides hominis]|uniref:carboxylesterase/lipase family protein n=1 Tax=Sandaracinobacteroides hominis TaxID=2780086 RepID=UPI0018F5A55A|nr:carboxylesterase family protein [Sandaracinobacteroides hominis]
MSVAEISRRAALGLLAAAPAILHARTGAVAAPAGRFTGVSEAGVHAFKGIRYGLKPERFQPPTAAPTSGETVRAESFAPSAPQAGKLTPTSEDCLFLNLWTPSADAARRPVLVYFHGGAYSGGTVAEAQVEGAQLASRGDVVVVTVNHRLNALGYLYLARLDPRFPTSGNNGQLDLILALQWVQSNISAFGGDPANVTVFGQSGGGAKIATLLSMPRARGLFHKGLTMSGQQVTASGPLNATRRAQAFLDRLNATPAEAARLPVELLTEALAATDPVLGGGVYFGPVLDMEALPRHPFYPDADAAGLGIPLMLGNTVAETRAFFPPSHPKLQGLNWDNLAQRMGPELRIDIKPEWVVQQFRAHDPSLTPEQLFIRATTTGRSWRGQLIEAEERAAASAPAFVYQLDYRNAAHMDDIPLMFGTFGDPADRSMSERMMDALLRFARTGNPGWPAYTLPGRETMIFDAESRVEQNPRAFERELFARVPYIQPGS